MSVLQRALGVVKQGVLGNVRLQANFDMALSAAASSPVSLQLLRRFADASYLDKSEVTDRVLNVVKNFEKVDPAKVRCLEFMLDLNENDACAWGIKYRRVLKPCLGSPDLWCDL